MNKENKKEILTRDIIRKDIKGILVHNILCNLLFSALFWFCVSMFYGIYLLGDSIEDIVKIEMFFYIIFYCAECSLFAFGILLYKIAS